MKPPDLEAELVKASVNVAKTMIRLTHDEMVKSGSGDLLAREMVLGMAIGCLSRFVKSPLYFTPSGVDLAMMERVAQQASEVLLSEAKELLPAADTLMNRLEQR